MARCDDPELAKMTADQTESANRDELLRRQWEIVEELRRQGDPTSNKIVELMEKILKEGETPEK